MLFITNTEAVVSPEPLNLMFCSGQELHGKIWMGYVLHCIMNTIVWRNPSSILNEQGIIKMIQKSSLSLFMILYLKKKMKKTQNVQDKRFGLY